MGDFVRRSTRQSETAHVDDSGTVYVRTDSAAPSDGAANAGTPATGILGFNGTTWDRIRSLTGQGDGASLSTDIPNPGFRFNSATWDRERNNENGSALASAARTTATSSATFINYNARGILVFLNVTVASGTGGLQVVVQGLDPVSSGIVQLNATPAAIIATGLRGYMLYPTTPSAGVGAAAGVVQQATSIALPRSYRIDVLVGDASSYTYSVGFALIV